jgi:hypothetical protein
MKTRYEDGQLSTASIAGAGGAPVQFFEAIATTGDRRKEAVMDWSRGPAAFQSMASRLAV